MSTIVVVKKNGQVCIAADTLTSFGDTKLASSYDRFHDKIQDFGQSHIGIVGSAAHALVVEHAFRSEEFELDFSSRDGIFDTFLRLHGTLKDKYFLNAKAEDDDPYETTHIEGVIANAKGIFAVYGLRDVTEFERFWAIGSGADYALGAMFALYDRLDTAEAIARAGVEAGAEFNNASSLPVTTRIVTLEENS